MMLLLGFGSRYKTDDDELLFPMIKFLTGTMITYLTGLIDRNVKGLCFLVLWRL
jgi:hypothetical protein